MDKKITPITISVQIAHGEAYSIIGNIDFDVNFDLSVHDGQYVLSVNVNEFSNFIPYLDVDVLQEAWSQIIHR
jgi:hypothetical protein